MVEDDSAHTETAAAERPENTDSNTVLIKSLVSSVQKLTMDVQSLCLTRTHREVHYEDLTCTMAEFVAGYAQILQSKDIISLEVSERQKHLVSLICLMYFAQQFTWSAFLDKFYDAVLLEIERALIQWRDSFMHL